MMQVPHLVGSVLLSQRKRPSCYRGRRVVFGISNLATPPETYALSKSHTEANCMELLFWMVTATLWLGISVDSARRQTPLLLLEQAHSQ